jgi:hypothetical protein
MSIVYIKDDTILTKTTSINIKEGYHFAKSDIITSSVDLKDIITFTFKLPKSTPKEQLKTEAEIYFYENAGLDLNKRFVSFYIFKELEEEDIYIVEAIAIEEEILYQKFKPLLEHIHYIDFISLSTFSFSEFYRVYDIEPKKDAFVYLDNNQSFIAIYENGKYLYSKTLNPLSPLLKVLDIEYDKFVEIISTKGVNKEKYEVDEFLMAGEIERFFSDYFMAINNRVSYGKTIFYLDSIDNIYFYAPFRIEGIETLKNFWDINGINFEIIPIEEINFLDKITLLYNEKHYKDEINFSIFPRPPKFYKTKTFQLVSVIFLTLAIFGGDFWYRYYKNQQISQRIEKLDKLIKMKQKKLNQLKIINQKILTQYEQYNNQIDDINKKIKAIKFLLERSLVLANSPQTNGDFILISKLMQKNKLNSFIMQKDSNNSFSIGIYTKFKNRKFIAIFMDDLLANRYKNIRTDKISTINNDYYFSLIRFQK